MKSFIWIASILAALLALGIVFYRTATMAHTHAINYDTYISIVLTALAVILAALAIFVGAAAIWGYQQISIQAEMKAEKAVGEKMAKLLKVENVKKMIEAHVKDEGDQLFNDLVAETQQVTQNDKRQVGDPYP